MSPEVYDIVESITGLYRVLDLSSEQDGDDVGMYHYPHLPTSSLRVIDYIYPGVQWKRLQCHMNR